MMSNHASRTGVLTPEPGVASDSSVNRGRSMHDKPGWGRKIVSHLPLVAAVIGMTIVFGSVVVFYFGAVVTRIAAVSVGLLVLVGGIWYAANPFIKNERQYTELRAELDGFIGLVRELNGAALSGGSDGDVAQAKSKMHESVDRMVDLAGK